METTTILQPPSLESFSYTWLTNSNSNSNPISTVDYPSHDHHDETSFIEMDPRLPPSKRFLRVFSSDYFCFDFSVELPLGLVHADDLIHDDNNNNDMIDTDHRNNNNYCTTITVSKKRVRRWSLRKCQRMSMRFFQRYLKYLLRPFLYRKRYQFDGQVSAATLSPRTSLAYSSADDNWRNSCDSECSIYDAVLHCKKTQR